MYTSGSTGQPKGVMIEHRNVCNHLSWVVDEINLTPKDRFAHKYSMAFDPSVIEIFAPLLVGACVYIFPEQQHFSGDYLAQWIIKKQITCIDVTPSTLRSLLEEVDLLAGKHQLKCVLCGGETLTADIQRRFADQINAELFNMYGPTETTIAASSFRCSQQLFTNTIPIGRPIANTEVYVLDDRMQPVPIGVWGELYVGGDGVGRGYWRREALTAERFIDSPFGEGRLYCTGDVVRIGADGVLEFRGRVDNQVKIRGFRVEPGEVEAVLSQHPGVREVAVVAGDDVHGQKRLLAYVVATEAGEDTTALRGYLTERLPDYMIPALFIHMKALPVSANGKVDRANLPDPGDSRPQLQAKYVQPRTELETTIGRIWKGVLGLNDVGVHDNFFDLGGHSLLLVQLQRQLQQTLQRSVELVHLFEFPTVASLAQQLDQQTHSNQAFTDIQQRMRNQQSAIQQRNG